MGTDTMQEESGPDFRAEEEAAVRAEALAAWKRLAPACPASTMPDHELLFAALGRLVEYRARLECRELAVWALAHGWEVKRTARSLCMVQPDGEREVLWTWFPPRDGPGALVFAPDEGGAPSIPDDLVNRIRAQREAAEGTSPSAPAPDPSDKGSVSLSPHIEG